MDRIPTESKIYMTHKFQGILTLERFAYMNNNITDKAFWQAINKDFPEECTSTLNRMIDQQTGFSQKFDIKNNPKFLQKFSIKQRHIAWDTDCKLRTAHTRVRKLVYFGYLIQYGDGSDGNPCQYSVNPLLYKYAHLLQDKFTSLRNFIKQHGTFHKTQHVFRTYSMALLLPLLATVCVPSYNDNFNYNPCISVSHRDSQIFSRTGGFQTKREEMEETGTVRISPTLQEISKSLKLTQLGQAKLLMFPDSVLVSVWPLLKDIVLSKESPFNYLFAGCLKWCEKNNLQREHGVYSILVSRWKLDPNGPVSTLQKSTNPTRSTTVYPGMKKEQQKDLPPKSSTQTLHSSFKNPTGEYLLAKHGDKPHEMFANLFPQFLADDTLDGTIKP